MSFPAAGHPKTAARLAAIHALTSIDAGQIRSLSLADAPDESRGFGRELLSGTLRLRSRLDWTLAPLLTKDLEKLDPPVRAALRLALYERLVMGTPLPALGNEYAGLMRVEKLTSATGFVNAVVRRLPAEWRASTPPRESAQFLATEFAHPRWLVKRWLARLGPEACAALLEANNRTPSLCLRVNTAKATRESVLASLVGRGVAAKAGVLSPQSIVVESGGDPALWPEWRAGLIIAQDEAAQLVALLAAPAPGALVVDAASAPGGKTTHLAQFMGDSGRIIACDVAPGRLKLVRENAARLGQRSIETRGGDFKVLAGALLGELTPRGADLVLLDAPCSGTGTMRRRPDAKWRKRPEQIVELVALQRELLDAAATLVASGGSLVYSTCSLEAEENENQIDAWLAANPQWVKVPVIEVSRSDEANIVTEAGYLQTWPHIHNCDGMFAAKLRRAV